MQDRPGGDGFDVVLVAEPAFVTEADEAIALAGGRLLATIGWDDAGAVADASPGQPVLVVEAEGVSDDVLAAGLPLVRELAEARGLHVVAVLGRAQIDLVAEALMGPGAQLLCEPSLAERVAAIAVAGQASGETMLADGWREGEAERLKKLNEEVARIAEVLARLAKRGEGGGGDEVGDRHLSFGFAPPATEVDPAAIRQTIRGRRMRDGFFGENLFEDPAWDMLLDLYASYLEGGRVSVSSLCIAAAVAPTTALRWIGKMTELHLFERQPDPADRRRAFMALSPRAVKAMGGYVAATRRAGVPIA
ncbi:Winged helix DNA-binding domain-containing protein [Sphingomonas rubra]|uniref:Winged helix DNA-binding domain-containing protein n=1 Tax=Sphingomonas rubra TaxID=634430 RepID=A0A1I5TXI8_9SPHN|nr:Winged helix DNA-binding domain-containing protein [Sphingomonas rubra]